MADEYRKPATQKAATPRGTVVRQPDGPPVRSPIATGADPRNNTKFAAEAAAAAAELERAKRSMDITSRVLGAMIVASALCAVLAMRPEYIALGYLASSPRGRVLMGLSVTIGPWLLVFGNGGAADPSRAPVWYRWGVLVAGLVGVMLAETGTLYGVIESLLALTT